MGKDKTNRGGACASSSRAAAGGFGGNVFAGYDRGRHRLVVIFLVSFRTMTTSPISFSSFRPTTMSLPGPGLEFGTDLTFSRHTKHTSRAASERPRYPGCRHRDTPCLLTNVISPSDIFSISSHSTSKKTKKKHSVGFGGFSGATALNETNLDVTLNAHGAEPDPVIANLLLTINKQNQTTKRKGLRDLASVLQGGAVGTGDDASARYKRSPEEIAAFFPQVRVSGFPKSGGTLFDGPLCVHYGERLPVLATLTNTSQTHCLRIQSTCI